VSNYTSGDFFSKGTTDVVYTATDSHGNMSSCTFRVIVEDRTAPVFQNCVNNININAGAQCEAIANWIAPLVDDNCETHTLQSTYAPGSTFPLGVTKVIYTAADASGNISECEFTVTVKNETPPVFQDCPDDILLTGDEFGRAVAEWSSPLANAVCGDVTVTSSHRNGDSFSIGSTKVEYTATDISGNTASCSFNVVVAKQEIDIGITKVVTPDNNGVNDEWVLTNIEKFANNEIVIVDRWGSVIYSARGYNNNNVVWKGISQNGAAVPTGTYFYRLTVRYGEDSIEKTGFIELIR
jgi:gliding motility-associated-like protein